MSGYLAFLGHNYHTQNILIQSETVKIGIYVGDAALENSFISTDNIGAKPFMELSKGIFQNLSSVD